MNFIAVSVNWNKTEYATWCSVVLQGWNLIQKDVWEKLLLLLLSIIESARVLKLLQQSSLSNSVMLYWPWFLKYSMKKEKWINKKNTSWSQSLKANAWLRWRHFVTERTTVEFLLLICTTLFSVRHSGNSSLRNDEW